MCATLMLHPPTRLGLFCLLLSNLLFFSAPAQNSADSLKLAALATELDTGYVRVFPGLITTRAYFSKKYTNLQIEESRLRQRLNYDPNTSLNLGIGATLGTFTLNLAYGFDFLNPERGRGDTRYLDLQSHVYKRKFVLDIFGQFYRGMYLENTRSLNPTFPEPYYLRPDIHLNLFGLHVQRVLNDRRFSYAAPLVQNEYQKKSAGSALMGAKVSLLRTTADTSFVPPFLDDANYRAFSDTRMIRSFQFGPSLGYAYSLVFLRHYFLMASLNLQLLLGPTRYTSYQGQHTAKWELNPAGTFRAALGYNSDRMYIGLQLVNDNVRTQWEKSSVINTFTTGNLRFSVARRFTLGPKTRKQLHFFSF